MTWTLASRSQCATASMTGSGSWSFTEMPMRQRGPHAGVWRDLAGHDDRLGPLGEHLRDQTLRVAVAVGQRGVDERAAGVQRGVQRLERGAVVAALPHGAADAPGPKADF